MPPPLWTPPPLRKFHLKFAHHCIAFRFLHNDPPPLTPLPVVQQPGCTPALRKFPPPWTPPPLRKIHVHPFWQDPAGCARSMVTHCARSMFLHTAQDPCPPTAQYPCPPTTEDPCPPLKHAQYILKSMEADHCRALPTGRGKTRNTTIYHGTKYEDANTY